MPLLRMSLPIVLLTTFLLAGCAGAGEPTPVAQPSRPAPTPPAAAPVNSTAPAVAAVASPAAAPSPSSPVTVTLRVDPARVKGDPNAPVTLFDFSDFR